MSRKRKNAGEGYGYMFHGAFAEKKDAVAKERKTKGAFIRGTPTRHGYRYIVMSPRTNPIKRRKKKVVKPAHNPSDLIVLGANPSPSKEQEIKIPIPGGEVTIRTNPEARTNSLGSFLGFSPSKPTKKELAESRRSFRAGVRRKRQEEREYLGGLRKSARAAGKHSRQARVFHELYGEQKYDADGLPINPAEICGARIGGYQCTRKPGHRGPHLPQGATLRPASRHNWGKRGNPSAEALRETFTGKAVDRIAVMSEPHMRAGDYAKLGTLLALYVKPVKGGQIMQIQASGGTILVGDESARQMYFVGGDQDVSLGLALFGARDRGEGLWELGEARRIDYRQRKEHVPHPEADSWRHDFGEENGERPTVLFDVRVKRLLLEGGDYRIEEAGIIN
jgi:hypothetical protein